jgi:hypothetical protein
MANFGKGRARRPGDCLAALAGALLTLALLAGPAAAATGVDLGPTEGGNPGLAITSDGTGYVTYSVESADLGHSTLYYCRLDPGTTNCAAGDRELAAPESAFNLDFGNWPVVVDDVPYVIEARSKGGGEESKLLWGGLTTPAVHLGAGGAGFRNFGEAVVAPAGTINATEPLFVTLPIGSRPGPVLSASTDKAGTSAPSLFHITGDEVGDSAVGTQGKTLGVAWIDQALDNQVLWRHYNGGGLPSEVQAEAKWSTATGIGAAAGASPEVRIASGPKGLYVVFNRSGDNAVVAERYNGVAFDPPVVLTPGGVTQFAVSEDPAGLLHVAYADETGAYYRYAKNADNTEFSNAQTLPPGDYTDMRIATTAAGDGWLSWREGESGVALVIPIAPGEPAPPSAPATGGGGAPAKPTPKGPAPAPAPAKKPNVVIFGALGHGLVGSLTVPKQCVPGGDVFKAKVAVKRKGSQAHKTSYTVKAVTFLLGKKKIATDKTKPFEVGFATKGAGTGKALAVAARISVGLHLKHKTSTVTKTLKTTVRTCK